jgi:hypothetical protein
LEALHTAEAVVVTRPGAHTVTCVMTDGEENMSSHTAGDVRNVVERMIASGHHIIPRHIVLGLGVGNEAFFRGVFRSMGIPEGCILVVAATAQGVRSGMGSVGAATSSIFDAASFTTAAHTGFTSVSGTVAPGPAPIESAAAGPRPAAPPPTMPPPGIPGGWRPAGFSLRWTGSGWQESEEWSSRWNVLDCVYTIDAPTAGTWIIIGSGREAGWDSPTRDVISRITADFHAQGLGGEIVYVPLEESGTSRYISRAHALIVPNPDGTFEVTALRGGVAIPRPDSTVRLSAHRGQNTAVPQGQDVQFAREDRATGRPAIVIRLG